MHTQKVKAAKNHILNYHYFEKEIIGFLRHGGVPRRPLSNKGLKISINGAAHLKMITAWLDYNFGAVLHFMATLIGFVTFQLLCVPSFS